MKNPSGVRGLGLQIPLLVLGMLILSVLQLLHARYLEWAGHSEKAERMASALLPLMPEDAGFRYSSPEHFVAPHLRLFSHMQLDDHWRAGLRVGPGAFVGKRAGERDRFPTSQLPTLYFGLDTVYSRAAWAADGSGEWSGTTGPDHRAGVLRVQFSLFPGEP